MWLLIVRIENRDYSIFDEKLSMIKMLESFFISKGVQIVSIEKGW